MTAIATTKDQILPVTLQNFKKIAFKVGTIKGAEIFNQARGKSYKVTVELGKGYGSRQSAAQLGWNYSTIKDLFNRKVLTVMNLEPRRIAGYKSEVLIVGFPDKEKHVHLLNTRGASIEDGTYLTLGCTGTSKKINYNVFESAHVLAATVKSVKAIIEETKEIGKTKKEEEKEEKEEKENTNIRMAFTAELDLGKEIGTRYATLLNLKQSTAKSLINTQVAAVVNIQQECVTDPTTFVFAATTSGGEDIPFGVDSPVENGVKLF